SGVLGAGAAGNALRGLRRSRQALERPDVTASSGSFSETLSFRSSPRKRGPSPRPWIPAFAGMSGVCCVVLAIRLLSSTLAGSRDRRADASLARANFDPSWGCRMTRIAIIDRADMNAEQARVYGAAKQSTGVGGGPYHAYIRLPKVFEACQNLRATLASGPLTRREQQIVNLAVARHWNARYPWYAQPSASSRRSSTRSTRARPRV